MIGQMMAEEQANRDPRIERSRKVILEATVDELAEVGYGALTIESVAKRAGVGKATIYRQWRGKVDLVESVLEMIRVDVVVPAEGTVRERVTGLLQGLAFYLSDSRASSCMPTMVSAAHYDDAVGDFQFRFATERRQILVDLLSEGVATGELDSDIDPGLTAEILAGPLFYRRLMTNEPFPAVDVPKLVEAVLGRPTKR
ncbi:MAG: TetR family transcriptional regulator [Actinobacteria bacterium]|nr:MAG: TetR family transcriptional regulator [Actinomycetota bacterium]